MLGNPIGIQKLNTAQMIGVNLWFIRGDGWVV